MTKRRKTKWERSRSGRIITALILLGFAAGVIQLLLQEPHPATVQCTFDHNEIGPMGDHGQWYWDIFKCRDGSERRQLVAGSRG